MIRVSKLTALGTSPAARVLEALDARVVLEDGVLERRLPLPNQRQPLLGVLQAGLGLAQGFLLLGHRRRVVGPLLKIAAEDLGTGPWRPARAAA